MRRSATAHWFGNMEKGKGSISTESESITNLPYSFAKRFGEERGANPEELIAAAHSGCFSMALAGELSKQGLEADDIETTSFVDIEPQGDGFGITTVHLNVFVSIPGADPAIVKKAAEVAKVNCPVSKVLNAKITMNFSITPEEQITMHS